MIKDRDECEDYDEAVVDSRNVLGASTVGIYERRRWEAREYEDPKTDALGAFFREE